MDRRDYLVINAPRRHRDRARAAGARGHPGSNASIGIAFTRDRRFVLANPHFEQMLGWAARRADRPAGRAVWAERRRLRRASAPLSARRWRAASRSSSSAQAAAPRRQHLLAPRARPAPSTPTRPAEGGTVWIVEDVTERRQFEQALARARDDAEAASRAKSAFLANTSHEIAHAAERHDRPGAAGARSPTSTRRARRQYLDQIADSAQALAGIISDILDLSKIEAGKLHARDRAPSTCASCCARCSAAYATLAEARGLALRLRARRRRAEGACAATRCACARSSATTSATRSSSPRRARCACAARRLDAATRVRFEVHDTGPGIDEATQRAAVHALHAGRRVDHAALRRHRPGPVDLPRTGHADGRRGGRATARPGQGSCFWAELPLPARRRRAAAARRPRPPTRPRWQGARVLMVEDNPVNMMIAVAMLEQLGRATWRRPHDGQRGGGRGARAARRTADPFDAVLMDVQMPVMSGHEATRVLRRSYGRERAADHRADRRRAGDASATRRWPPA